MADSSYQVFSSNDTEQIAKDVRLSDNNDSTYSISVNQSSTGSQKELVFFRLSTDGNGAGETDMAVDGSVTPVEFYVQPPVGEIWRIARSMIYIQDEKGFDVGTWGSGLILTNGHKVEIKHNGVVNDILGFNLKTSGDISSIAYDTRLDTFGNADDILVGRWTFTRAGQFIRLDGDKGDYFKVIVNDDLSDLSAQYIQVQGYKE
jgi:hypothetical protein